VETTRSVVRAEWGSLLKRVGEGEDEDDEGGGTRCFESDRMGLGARSGININSRERIFYIEGKRKPPMPQ